MTTVNEVREKVYETFVAGWGATSPYTFDNEDYEPNQSAPWVRLSVRNRNSVTETLGSRAYRKQLRSGAIFLQIFVPSNDGLRNADALVRKFREIFENKTLIPATLWVTSVEHRELATEQNQFLVLCEANFTYNDTI